MPKDKKTKLPSSDEEESYDEELNDSLDDEGDFEDRSENDMEANRENLLNYESDDSDS